MNEDLLRTLHRDFQSLDPVPAGLTEAAKAAFAFRDPDARLATLVSATALTSAGLRSATRLVTFTTGETTITVEVTPTGPTRSLTGTLAPAAAALLTVHSPTAAVRAPLDPGGRFIADDIPSGLVMLHLSLPDGTSIVTNWTRL
ncbi:hypothetical protein [Actinocorallia longicatena]|uniref:Uncharacterized protein n=1 Tax=Actinocorallia longicatena TaxID=111803 RepID=A0ABP6QC31_9ACTN